MPIGTGFENSAMKTSFSLSSLQTTIETPNKGVIVRTCNSLNTKKKRTQEYWRRSWGSTAGSTLSDQKDDFWSALQANYDYIMDNQLIDNCQEANGELTLDTRTWSLKEFYLQFSELYSWLNSIQETFCRRINPEESLKNRYISEVIHKQSLLKTFNEQASHLMQLHPEKQEEVTWRAMKLNSKWESVGAALGLSDCSNCNLHTCTDIEHELKRLRIWIKTTEALLQPLDFQMKWSKTELEDKILIHQSLHRDIESHGKLVTSVIKICSEQHGIEAVNARRIAKGLEKRYHLLFLRSLEWQCYIDSESKKIFRKNRTQTESSDSENYDEPLNKYPRMGDSFYEVTDKTPNENNFEKEPQNTHKLTMVKSVEEDNFKETNPTNETNSSPGPLKSSEDNSVFNKSNRNAPNVGHYYFKHDDTTDSELPNSFGLKKSIDESSEDEWTYSSNKNNVKTTSKTSCQNILRLVQEAEELVRESPVKRIKSSTGAPINKMSRVKQWLNMEKPSDSCDASCEEEEKDSLSSEDLNESVATCLARQDCFSTPEKESPKVLFRQKRTDLKRNRPWSMSCISQLPYASLRVNKEENFSISESALHQLPLSPKYSKSLTTIANCNSSYQNNSTSSTMDDGGTILVEHNSTPMRRRRLKLKKKSNSRRRSIEPSYSDTMGTLVKSGSFSGSSQKIINSERHTASDPPTIRHGQTSTLSNNTSEVETDEDGHNKRKPTFKIGDPTTYLLPVDRDNSPDKSAHNAEEQSSSLSEQAWDSYQEKYLSDVYSEAQDSDAARRLLEFGEDYRNFIDSQSDWSAQSTNPEFSPPFKRKTLSSFKVLESESDSEDLRNLLTASREEFLQAAKTFKKLSSGNCKDKVATSDCGIIATCERHLHCLSLIEKSPEEYCLSKLDKQKTTDLLSQWRGLKEKAKKMKEYINLTQEILQLKEEFLVFTPSDEVILTSLDDIHNNIEFYSTRLISIKERRAKLLTINVTVHRFVIENNNYNSTTLKADISELYRMWYDIHSSTAGRLNQLKCSLQTWQTLDSRLDQFCGDLQEDKETLATLDSAVRNGVLSNRITSSVREVVKVLSETNQGSNLPGLLSESSYSDSGISDEGSEHEHGERERRLASIRHLMMQLENNIGAKSFVRVDVNERFTAAEDELRMLQERCRSLVVRSKVIANNPSCEVSEVVGSDPGDPDGNPGRSWTSWFKRVVRVAIPFEFAMLTLICILYLIEPNCCDNMNTFAWSLTPQLRHIRGPPPI